MQLTVTLTADGHLLIPEAIRNTHRWQSGMKFTMTEVGDSILLAPEKTVKQTTLEEVAGCLRYSGEPKSLEDMEAAIAKGIRERGQ